MRAAIAKHPEDAGLTAQLATALSAEGNDAEAITTLERLHQLQPVNADVTAMLADAYMRNGAPEKAAPLLAEAVQASPTNANLVLTSYGQSLIYTKQFACCHSHFGASCHRWIRMTRRPGEASPSAHSQLHQDSAVIKDLCSLIKNRAGYTRNIVSVGNFVR